MLKADFHIHVSGDPLDTFIKYSPEELIDRAAEKRFEVIAITCHEEQLHEESIARYAESRGILLIPGVERTIEGKHVLLINFKKDECKKIRTFAELRKHKRNNNLIIAPHPFYPEIFGSPLQKKFWKNQDLFDGVEFSSFWTSMINWPNVKAVKAAGKLDISVIGNSDAHDLSHLNTTFTLIDAEKTIPAVIKAVKEKRIKLKAKPLSLTLFIGRALWMSYKGRANFFKRVQSIIGL